MLYLILIKEFFYFNIIEVYFIVLFYFQLGILKTLLYITFYLYLNYLTNSLL